MTAKEQELNHMIEQYSDMIFRLAFTRVRNKSDAEDICQEVLLKWFEHPDPFQSEEHRRAWLIRVTLNCTSSLLASSWFKRTVPLPETLHSAPREETEVLAAVMRLPKTDRTLIHLFYYEDMTTAETAELTGMTQTAVRTRLSRARKRLGEILKGVVFDDEK